MKRKSLNFDKIRIDGDTQPRAGINTALVAEYEEAYESGAELPPVIVFFDGTDYWLADGFHRWHAKRKTGVETIFCEIYDGTVDDARWYSYAANQTHGQRRTNADKQKAVKAALLHPKGAGMSDNQIAEHVGVSHPFVGKLRKELEEANQLVTVTSRAGKDGKVYDTTNIGRKDEAEEEEEKSGKKNPPVRSIKEAADDLLGDDQGDDTDLDPDDEPEVELPPRTQQDASSEARQAIRNEAIEIGETIGNVERMADFLDCIAEEVAKHPATARVWLENLAVTLRSRAA